jgi:hypothetical protein
VINPDESGVPGWTDVRVGLGDRTVHAAASWLNAIEGFFAILTKRRIKRGVFRSIIDLQGVINRYIAEHNLSPKPFAWTKDAEKIIAAVKRGHQALDSIH